MGSEQACHLVLRVWPGPEAALTCLFPCPASHVLVSQHTELMTVRTVPGAIFLREVTAESVQLGLGAHVLDSAFVKTVSYF